MNPFDGEGDFSVITNREEQHSIWPISLAVPDGWQVVLSKGTKRECLAYVDEAWDDITPRSARRNVFGLGEVGGS